MGQQNRTVPRRREVWAEMRFDRGSARAVTSKQMGNIKVKPLGATRPKQGAR